ncbi:two-component sensor histidine kinase [Streptomyces alfalfae]|uniref:histidine kinase n=1 Tax=Streptomyces alfalfae TaxID=1642299 RepID=A0ABM6H0G5_9ACTN|nr:histidine kinase [Streptomyces alfalfae]AYA20141.1 two-component sensor histidine kinase [Streptomyces fradiae]APY89694.1 two-component sensor histidine kinase [Streptomyces alfalfae]QUI30260.1 two-component sensor histidine kinase [Streptomyces alfalfae]RXX43632.1 two-component sensor histidine kinase [Streptomyces alfalfae]RZN01392.1 two-component sensor histidine kinase [Streptomyces alfalfae]
MPGFLRPLTRAFTYTRWLHVLLGSAIAWVSASIYPGLSEPSYTDWALVTVVPVPLLVAAAMVPVVRRAEGLQARMMLFPGQHARVPGEEVEEPGISVAPSASWRDRVRTAVWLVFRLETGIALVLVTGQLIGTVFAVTGANDQPPESDGLLLPVPGPGWSVLPVSVLLVLAEYGALLAAGHVTAVVARRLLGPSPAERLAVMEERTERLLERNRIARELHDSIGHALTVAVVQAGAARAAADPEFTARALEAVEETGRAALEDLERVLRVLREGEQPVGARPDLTDAERLLQSARAAGAKVDVEVTGPVERLPGPVSREGYRMLQEALTNVLRHSGPVPVRLRIAADASRLVLEVRNALPGAAGSTGRGGSGLRGIRERATLLGGRATTGPLDGDWQVHVELPLR